MARRARTPDQPAARPRTTILASAAPVDISKRGAAKLIATRAQAWQEEAWAAFDGVGEIGHTLGYRANVISKVRLVAGVRTDNPSDPPVPVDVAVAENLISQGSADMATEIVDRFDQGPGLAALLHKCSLNLDVPGDLHVVGEGTGDDETWRGYSDKELTDKSGSTHVPGDDGKPRRLSDSLAFRLWQPHPRESQLATSSLMQLVLEGLPEELLLISMEMRAGSKSRVHKGLLGLNQDVVFASKDDATASADVADGEGPSLIDDIIQWGTSAMDPGSVASQLPGIVLVPGGVLDNWAKHVDFGQKIDERVLDRARYVVERIANGINMPKEVTLGLGDVNHWAAAVISREGFRAYMEPTVLAIVHGFTVGALRPRLQASGVAGDELRRLVVWYDEQHALAPENKVETASRGVEIGALGRAAWRRVADFDEDDKPTPEEILEHLGADRTILTAELSLAILKMLGLLPETTQLGPAAPEQPALPPAPPVTEEIPDPAEPADTTEPAPETEPFTAAGAPGDTGVGDVLAGIDRRLFDRLQTASDAAVERAVERANNRLRSLANRDPRAKAASASGPTPARGLGRPWAVRLAAGDDADEETTVAELVAGAFAGTFLTRVEGFIAGAQEATLAEVLALAPDELTDVEVAEARGEADDDRSLAITALVAALTALAVRVLFDGGLGDDAPGEIDPSVSVPAGLVRRVMAVAGGARTVEATVVGGLSVDGRPVGGVATGERSRVLFARVRAWWNAYRWNYGDASTRARPFLPHQALGGRVFARWDDPVLTNRETSWLPTTTYSPGDHAGCRCDWTPIVVAPPAVEDVAA